MRNGPQPITPAKAVALLSVLCPQCETPLARVPRPDRDLAACLNCGLYGSYDALTERGTLDGGVLSAREIEDFCAELGGLRDQAARAEATDRGD